MNETKLKNLNQKNKELTRKYKAERPNGLDYLIMNKKARQEANEKTRKLKEELIKVRREIRKTRTTTTLKEWLFDNSIAHPAACTETRAQIIFVIICSILLTLFVIFYFY